MTPPIAYICSYVYSIPKVLVRLHTYTATGGSPNRLWVPRPDRDLTLHSAAATWATVPHYLGLRILTATVARSLTTAHLHGSESGPTTARPGDPPDCFLQRPAYTTWLPMSTPICLFIHLDLTHIGYCLPRHTPKPMTMTYSTCHLGGHRCRS